MRTLALLLAAVACAGHGLSLVPAGRTRTALWLAALEAAAEIDSVRYGVMCLAINHGTAAWQHDDYRSPDSLLIQEARGRGLIVVSGSSCRTPDGFFQRWRDGSPAYDVVIQAGELTRQGDGVRLRVAVYPVRSSFLKEPQPCQGHGFYRFKRDEAGWHRMSDSVHVVCM